MLYTHAAPRVNIIILSFIRSQILHFCPSQKEKKWYRNLWLSPKWKPSLSLFKKKYLKNKNKPPVLSSRMRDSALCNIHLGRLLCLSHTPRSMSSTMLSGDNNSWRWILRFAEAEHDGGVVLRLVIKGWNLQFTMKCLKPSLVHSSLSFSFEALKEFKKKIIMFCPASRWSQAIMTQAVLLEIVDFVGLLWQFMMDQCNYFNTTSGKYFSPARYARTATRFVVYSLYLSWWHLASSQHENTTHS